MIVRRVFPAVIPPDGWLFLSVCDWASVCTNRARCGRLPRTPNLTFKAPPNRLLSRLISLGRRSLLVDRKTLPEV